MPTTLTMYAAMASRQLNPRAGKKATIIGGSILGQTVNFLLVIVDRRLVLKTRSVDFWVLQKCTQSALVCSSLPARTKTSINDINARRIWLIVTTDRCESGKGMWCMI